jgi:hypothetical protein
MKCRSLAEVNLSLWLKIIDSHAFYWCKSLTDIDIPASVHYIADHAFQGCDSLQTITFRGLTKMDEDAGVFEDCTSLNAISVPIRYLDIYENMLPDALRGILIGNYY